MKIETLQDLLVEELKDLYGAEHQILEVLPKIAAAAEAEDLRQAFQNHLDATRGHIERLERVFQALGREAKRRHCKGMAGLLEEGLETVATRMPASVKDAALIAAAQKVEHYEIAGYGSARTFAQQLGDLESARMLQANLDEEGEADRTLTQLAEFSVNLEAAGVGPASDRA